MFKSSCINQEQCQMQHVRNQPYSICGSDDVESSNTRHNKHTNSQSWLTSKDVGHAARPKPEWFPGRSWALRAQVSLRASPQVPNSSLSGATSRLSSAPQPRAAALSLPSQGWPAASDPNICAQGWTQPPRLSVDGK